MMGLGGLIGGIIGYKFGNIAGMVLGFFIGYQVENFLTSGSPGRGGSGGHKKAVQDSFFEALFLGMGKIAKADGVVTPQEIQRAEAIFNHMRLTPHLRKRAINLFNKGKEPGFNIKPALRAFSRLSSRSMSLRQIFLEMLIDVAEADGTINGTEWRIIDEACDILRYPKQLLIAMMKMRGFRQQQSQHQSSGQSSGNQYRRTSSSELDPFTVLGVERNDSKASIRKAYKKLMSQHHPDKLIAKGLPPEMVKVAEEKAKKIQVAWEEVKKIRNF
ncbi:co-chaperone DjlA [Marinicella sp. W31]|uniref:co-chaperone DjlA n=1 Tax=Marinicella sp. W31 TaxID=3023713 RepID=UPI0037584875